MQSTSLRSAAQGIKLALSSPCRGSIRRLWSTLIACECFGRNARLAELNPKYTDVIVKRWQEYTGQGAVLAGKDVSFDEVAAARVA